MSPKRCSIAAWTAITGPDRSWPDPKTTDNAQFHLAWLGHGLKLTIAGVIAGSAGAMALTRVLESFLVGVSASDPGPHDPLTKWSFQVHGLAILEAASRAAERNDRICCAATLLRCLEPKRGKTLTLDPPSERQ